MFKERGMMLRGGVALGVLLAATFLVLYPAINVAQTTGRAVASGLKLLHPEMAKSRKQAVDTSVQLR